MDVVPHSDTVSFSGSILSFLEWTVSIMCWALFYIQHCPDGKYPEILCLVLTWSAWDRNTLMTHSHSPISTARHSTHPLTHLTHPHSGSHIASTHTSKLIWHSGLSTHILTHPWFITVCQLQSIKLYVMKLFYCSLTSWRCNISFEVDFGKCI